MKMLIPMLGLLTYVLAEPPVGDSYSSAHVHDHHDHGDIQRSLPDQYGPPAGTRNLPTQYGPPRSRSKPSQSYGIPNFPNSRTAQHGLSRLSETYGVPRSSSQEAPGLRTNSLEYLPSKSTDVARVRSNSLSTRTLSSSYGAPELRSTASEEYGTPISKSRLPATSYGLPELRSTPSEEYGVPNVNIRSYPAVSEQYGVPATRNNEQYSARNAKARLSQSYGVPKAQFNSQPSTSYGIPSAKDSDSYSQSYNSISETYGVPSQRDLSDTYGVPEARGLAQEYASSSRANLHTNAAISSYSNARTSPQSTYGAPSVREMPSEQYGVPEQYSNLNQGYEYSRAALEEFLNQEPANYDFAYKVNDYESGSDFGHTESRQENKAEGTYFVVLPDGTKQTVEYEADERGFKPRISVEPADLTRSGGYDDNASDLVRSGDGPY